MIEDLLKIIFLIAGKILDLHLNKNMKIIQFIGTYHIKNHIKHCIYELIGVEHNILTSKL